MGPRSPGANAVHYVQIPSQVELCWQTATNRFYQLVYSSALTINQWTPFHTNWVAGDGTRHCETDAITAGGSTRFYRLLCTNAPVN